MKLSESIANDRQRIGLSQAELASRLGVSQQAVSKWEEGQAAPRGKRLVQLTAVFGNKSETAVLMRGQQEPETERSVSATQNKRSTPPTTHQEALHAIAAAALELANAARVIAESVVKLAPPPRDTEKH